MNVPYLKKYDHDKMILFINVRLEFIINAFFTFM